MKKKGQFETAPASIHPQHMFLFCTVTEHNYVKKFWITTPLSVNPRLPTMLPAHATMVLWLVTYVLATWKWNGFFYPSKGWEQSNLPYGSDIIVKPLTRYSDAILLWSQLLHIISLCWHTSPLQYSMGHSEQYENSLKSQVDTLNVNCLIIVKTFIS